MSNYLRDLARVALMSSDALQTDIQRIQLLQKVIERTFSYMDFFLEWCLVRRRTKSVCCTGDTTGGKQ